MLFCIMKFVDRQEELARLEHLTSSEEGGLAVVYGRRRVGKTRLLLQWARKHAGVYTVADQSVSELQRRYFAEAVGARLPGFGDVEYRDWRSLLSRLAREAQLAGWRGPVILDELPYLVLASPELPSVLQRWVDHEALAARLQVAIAGSSQRMMQGFVLSGDAPLFGRAKEILEVQPLAPIFLREVFDVPDGVSWVELYCAWGGIPRYWELAQDLEGSVSSQVERLVLDPLGPLHREPDRLLLEEIPSALETRPLLDAIGSGAHRVSEIAGRLGRPTTSMARPLERLLSLGLVRRELPFGEEERSSKRALYKIADPFFRLWFRVVAAHRAQLASGTPAARRQLLARHWSSLCAQGWEELCRQQISRVPDDSPLGRLGPWSPASRWWHGAQPEWDLVSESLDGKRILLGEVKWSPRPLDRRGLERAAAELTARPAPPLPSRLANAQLLRVLLVPDVVDSLEPFTMDKKEPKLVTAKALFR